MTTRLRVLQVAAMAAGAIIAGCGGDDGGVEGSGAETTVTVSSITKAEFIEKANSICERGKAQLAVKFFASKQQHARSMSERNADLAATKVVLRPAIQAQIDEIRSLGAPRGDAVEIEAFFTSLSQAVDEVLREELSSPETLPVLQRAGDRANEYGFKQCAYGY